MLFLKTNKKIHKKNFSPHFGCWNSLLLVLSTIFTITVFAILSVRAVRTLRMTVFFVVCSALMFAVAVFSFVVRVRTGLMLAIVLKATIFVVAGSALFSNVRLVRGNIGKTKRLSAKFQIIALKFFPLLCLLPIRQSVCPNNEFVASVYLQYFPHDNHRSRL